ncbi:hypothetical protein GCS91_00790 [Delftia tsuruhatensis]|nr:hypothetical protein GCS91_00790 [Delftia tsuruhatensis]
MTYHHPLSRFAPSRCTAPPKGDDTFGAGRRGRPRPFLGVSGFRARHFHGQRATRSVMEN